MNKTKIIIIVSAVIIAGVTITTAMTLGMMGDKKEPYVEAENPQYESNWEADREEIEPSYEDQLVYEKVDTILGDKNGVILQEGEAIVFASELRRLILEKEYEEAEKYILKALAKYNIQDSPGYTSIIEPIRGDVPSLAQIDNLIEYEEYELAYSLINNLKDPNNLLWAILNLSPRTREQLITSSESLNPLYTELTEMDTAQKTRNTSSFYRDADIAYTIDFKLDGFSMGATIVDVDGWLRLEKITSYDENHPFTTIEEWRKQIEDVLSGLNQEKEDLSLEN